METLELWMSRDNFGYSFWIGEPTHLPELEMFNGIHPIIEDIHYTHNQLKMHQNLKHLIKKGEKVKLMSWKEGII